MNLHPDGSDPGGPLAPADWTMTIDSEDQGETVHYFADVCRDGERICRLALTGVAASKQDAHSRLALKARLWIADYLSRPHSGNTEFGAPL